MNYMHIWVKKLKFCRWELGEIKKKGRIFFLAKEELRKTKKRKKTHNPC